MTYEGWLYLCAIRDGHSRRVLGWAMDATHTTDLVERALRMAHTLRGEVPDDLVFHADRGTQFTSEQPVSYTHLGVYKRQAGR